MICVRTGQVLDEADRLLNEDFEKTLDEILNVIPQERRTYLFSATMTKKVTYLQISPFLFPMVTFFLAYTAGGPLLSSGCLM